MVETEIKLEDVAKAVATELTTSCIWYSDTFDQFKGLISKEQWQNARLTFDGSTFNVIQAKRRAGVVSRRITPDLQKAIEDHDMASLRQAFSFKDCLVVARHLIKKFYQGTWLGEGIYSPLPDSYLSSKQGFLLVLKHAFLGEELFTCQLQAILQRNKLSKNQLLAYQAACQTVTDPRDASLLLIDAQYLNDDYSGYLSFYTAWDSIRRYPERFSHAKLVLRKETQDYYQFLEASQAYSQILSKRQLIFDKETLKQTIHDLTGDAKKLFSVISYRDLDQTYARFNDHYADFQKEYVRQHNIQSLVEAAFEQTPADDYNEFEHFYKGIRDHQEVSYQGILFGHHVVSSLLGFLKPHDIFGVLPEKPTKQMLHKYAVGALYSPLFRSSKQPTYFVKEELADLDLTVESLWELPEFVQVMVK